MESIAPTHRVCTKCHQEKPLEDFVRSKDCRYGHAYECRRCKSTRTVSQRQHSGKRWKPSQKSKEKLAHYNKELYRSLKVQVMEAYGNRCVCCGESHLAFLTIDHIYNDGGTHRARGRMSGAHIYRWLVQNNFPQGRVQILCYNCNCSKQHDPEGHRMAHANARTLEPPAQCPLWGTDTEGRVQSGYVPYYEAKQQHNRWKAS